MFVRIFLYIFLNLILVVNDARIRVPLRNHRGKFENFLFA